MLKATVDIPRVRKDGRTLKPRVKTVTSRVHLSEDYPHLLGDFQKSFQKLKLPSAEFLYVHPPAGPERSALPHGSLPESWYHQAPGKVKLMWHPTVSRYVVFCRYF